MKPNEKVNTNNIQSQSRWNTLPVSWGRNKIHAKINFKWQIILEMSLMSEDEFIETENRIIALNKRPTGKKLSQDKGGTNTRIDWL